MADYCKYFLVNLITGEIMAGHVPLNPDAVKLANDVRAALGSPERWVIIDCLEDVLKTVEKRL